MRGLLQPTMYGAGGDVTPCPFAFAVHLSHLLHQSRPTMEGRSGQLASPQSSLGSIIIGPSTASPALTAIPVPGEHYSSRRHNTKQAGYRAIEIDACLSEVVGGTEPVADKSTSLKHCT